MENVIFGLSVAAVGMLIVFFGLTILIFCLKLMNAAGGKEKKNKPAPAPGPAAIAPMAPPPADVPSGEGELAAVIAAAVAALWQDEATGFVVRRIRRVNNAAAWQRAGREEQTYSRL